MKPLQRTVVAAALVLGGALAIASPAQSEDAGFASRLNPTRPAAHESGAGFAVVPIAADAAVFTAAGPGISEVRYRPRRYPPRSSRRHDDGYRSRRAEGYTEFHGGFIEPDGDVETQTVFGLKIAGMADPHIQVGGLVDWAHRGRTVTEIVSTSTGPGGEDIRTQIELARSSTDLVPMLAFLQFSGDDRMGLVPYVGVGGGYQLLFLSAEDFATGEDFDATFGGWGWQAWAGIGIPLSRQARLTAEIFRLGGTVSREVDDLTSGLEVREEVDVDGTGARFGIAFSF